MLRCLFQPPEESRRCSGVEVQWGEGWGHLPWPPGLSPAPVLLSPLSPTHSLLLSPVSTYRYPLSSPSLAPHSLLLLGVPTMGGRALPFAATWGILWGQGEHKTPAPLDWEGTQAGSTLAPSRVENGDLTRTPFLPTPGTAAVHLEKCQLQGGQRCWCGGMDPLSHRTNPEPMRSAGRGCRGSRTCCWDHPVLQAAGPGHHLLPPAPSARPLPPSCCPPRPGPDPDAGIAAAKLRKQSEPFKAEGGSPRGAGGLEAAAQGDPSGSAGGAPGARWGAGGGLGGGTEAGTEGAGGLLGQPPLQHFVLLLGRLTHHLPGEKHGDMLCHDRTRAPGMGTGTILCPLCLPVTPQCCPARTSPSRVSMVLIITVFLVCTSEPRWSGLVSAGVRTHGMGS